jgi:Beta-propeller domains of methanol dehydrogenase type
MKCPRCGLIVTDRVPTCRGCGFSITDLDRRLHWVPEQVGFVNDFAGLLSAEEKISLQARLSQLQQELDGEFVLVTINSTKPVKPSEFVFWLFNRWQVGGKAHTGLMILLTQKERRIECEVGYGWEPIISDVESGKVLDEQIVPLLKENKAHEALSQGTEQLASIIEQALSPRHEMPAGTSSQESEP